MQEVYFSHQLLKNECRLEKTNKDKGRTFQEQ